MPARSILKWPNNRLKNISSPVTLFDDNLTNLVSDLRDTMKANLGLGIAASQVGEFDRVFLIKADSLSDFDPDPNFLDCVVFVNPEINFLDKNTLNSTESCLSVPGVVATVPRVKKIEIFYQNSAGQKLSRIIEDRVSCIIQHEYDHLNGRLFIDRLSFLRRKRLKSKIAKSKKTDNSPISEEQKKNLMARKRKILRQKRKSKKKI